MRVQPVIAGFVLVQSIEGERGGTFPENIRVHSASFEKLSFEGMLGFESAAAHVERSGIFLLHNGVICLEL